MQANNGIVGEDDDHCKLLRRQLSNRALRKKSENELRDFVSWVIRDPGSIGGYDYGPMGQGFWSDVQGDNGDDDDDDDEDNDNDAEGEGGDGMEEDGDDEEEEEEEEEQ